MKLNITKKQLTLREKVLLIKEKKGLSSAEIARITGRSEGTVSDLLNSKKEFSDKLLNAISESLRDYMGEAELVDTRQFSRMWNIIKSGKTASDFRLIVGNTGIGKTIVSKKFAEENKCTCYYKIYNRNMSWNQFLTEVCRGFGIALPAKRKRYFTSELLNALMAYVEENADNNPQLIVDESEVMRNAFYKEFKNLRTATEDLLSIVIVGITDVKNRIAKLAGLDPRTWTPNREESNQYTTCARRIKVFVVQSVDEEDVKAFCNAKGIKNPDVIKEACKKWWNYDEADRAVKRASKMGICLEAMSVGEFNLL